MKPNWSFHADACGTSAQRLFLAAMIVRATALGLALVFATAAFAAAGPLAQSPAKDSQHTNSAAGQASRTAEDHGSRGAAPLSAVNVLAPPPKPKHDTTEDLDSQNAASHGMWENNSEFALVVATAFVALFTLLLAVYTALLYRSTAALAEGANKSAKDIGAMTIATERAYVKLSHMAPELHEPLLGGRHQGT